MKDVQEEYVGVDGFSKLILSVMTCPVYQTVGQLHAAIRSLVKQWGGKVLSFDCLKGVARVKIAADGGYHYTHSISCTFSGEEVK